MKGMEGGVETSDASSNEKKRLAVLMELLNTEQEYVRDLNLVNTFFVQPLRHKKILSEKDIGAIFTTLPTILSLNKALLSSLVDRLRWVEPSCVDLLLKVASPVSGASDSESEGDITGSGSCDSVQLVPRPHIVVAAKDPTAVTPPPGHAQDQVVVVADIFLETIDYFKLYTTYTNKQNEAREAIRRNKRHNVTFSRFLEAMQQKPQCRNLDLKAFLIKPVQRICQYPLLIEQILKYTDEKHPDYTGLTKALCKVREVADYVNQQGIRNKEIAKMIDIQHSLVDLGQVKVVEPNRHYVTESSFVRVGTRKSLVQLFLFNDCVIHSVPKDNNNNGTTEPMYIFKRLLPLKEVAFFDVQDTPQGKYKHNFEMIELSSEKKSLMQKLGKNHKSVVLQASSEEEKTRWLTEVNRCRYELQRKKDHRDMLLSAAAEDKQPKAGDVQVVGVSEHKAGTTIGGHTRSRSQASPRGEESELCGWASAKDVQGMKQNSWDDDNDECTPFALTRRGGSTIVLPRMDLQISKGNTSAPSTPRERGKTVTGVDTVGATAAYLKGGDPGQRLAIIKEMKVFLSDRSG